MALYKKITLQEATVLIWQVQESLQELSLGVNMTQKSSQRMASMKSLVHQKGFLAIRQLLLLAGYNDNDLFYKDCGMPYLSDGRKISITHSFEFAAIIISDHVVGIDIEKKREKIKTISSKFCNEKQLQSLESQDSLVDALTQVWCAKEAMYKMCNSRSLSFKEHMAVDLNGTSWVCKMSFRKEFIYYRVDLQDFMLVYAFEKN